MSFSFTFSYLPPSFKKKVIGENKKTGFAKNGEWFENGDIIYISSILKRQVFLVSSNPNSTEEYKEVVKFTISDSVSLLSGINFIPNYSEPWVIYNEGRHFSPLVNKEKMAIDNDEKKNDTKEVQIVINDNKYDADPNTEVKKLLEKARKKLENDEEGEDLLEDILISVREHAEKQTNWKNDRDLNKNILALAKKLKDELTRDEIENICRHEFELEEKILKTKQSSLIAQQLQN